MAQKELIRLQQVHKSYQLGQTSVPALRGLDLVLHKGEFTALIGASGSGKTTLLNLIGCLDRADSGLIEVDGQNVSQLSEEQLGDLRNHKIGFIFQSFHLIPVLNVFENVELPLTIRPEFNKDERRQMVEQALEDVGLKTFAHHLPD